MREYYYVCIWMYDDEVEDEDEDEDEEQHEKQPRVEPEEVFDLDEEELEAIQRQVNVGPGTDLKN